MSHAPQEAVVLSKICLHAFNACSVITLAKAEGQMYHLPSYVQVPMVQSHSYMDCYFVVTVAALSLYGIMVASACRTSQQAPQNVFFG